MKPLFGLSKIATLCLTLTGAGVVAIPAYADDDIQDQASATLQFTLITGEKVSAVVKPNGQLAGIRLHSEDGTEQVTSLYQVGNDQYIITPKSQALVESRLVDMELFNISKLHAGGYDDASSATLPVIIQYRDGALAGSAVPVAPLGSELVSEIELIDSAVIGINKKNAAEVWQSLTADTSVEALWLDAVIHADKSIPSTAALTPTVPLTGAYGPLAMPYQGHGVKVAVLDTGYDTEHHDLHGRVIASKDFTYSSNGVDDVNGHGTHTASTIAGTGAESNGLWVGVAPGAELIIGKVLGNNGGGSTSGILNGMQWAVAQGADIVSMSLGGSGTSCSGPLVDMVEALSNQALFVVSAGNSFTRETVGLPGCAPSALTVGALDRDNNTASFSSRGPSPDGHSAKPDISSQGVDVVAAASGGFGSTAYRALSGTSMSAPHVSGGAAILMQARPELSPKQVKDVLTSSVQKTDAHVLEQGAGPMDVNRAVGQVVIAAANQELGRFDSAAPAGMHQAAVTLNNLSDADVTLRLTLDLIGEDGSTRLPATLAGLGTKSVTIPAGGSTDVPVWIDSDVALRSGAYGTITGRLVGSDKDTQVTVPVSFWIEPPMVELSVSLTDHMGLPASSPSKVYIINEEDDWGSLITLSNGAGSKMVPKGNYSVIANIMTYDNASKTSGLVESATQMAYLDYKVETDTALSFDSRTAKKLQFKADKPLATQGFSFGFTYALDDNKLAKLAAIELAPDYVDNFYAWSQGHDDRFRSFVTTRAVAPETVLTTADGEVLNYVNQGLSLAFNGEGEAQVVNVGDAGYGTDWSQFDLQGKIALIANPYYLTSYMISNVAQKGAAGVIFYRPGAAGRYKTGITGTAKIPVVALSSEQGQVLADMVAEGKDTVRWSGTAPEYSPYSYFINHITDGHVQSGVITLQEKKMHKITAAYHSQNDNRPAWQDTMAATNSTGEFYSTGSPHMLMTPLVRDEYYTATSKNAWTNIVMKHDKLATNGGYFDGPRRMTEGAVEHTNWLKGARTGSLNSGNSAIASRDTNLLSFGFSIYGDADGHDAVTGMNESGAYGVKLDGSNVYLNAGTLTVPDYPAEVSLELRSYPRGVGSSSPIRDNLGSFYMGVYSFTTMPENQGVQPVLMPAVDLPLALDNTAVAGEPIKVTLGAIVDGKGPANLTEVSLQYGYGQECLPVSPSVFLYCPVSQKFADSSWQSAEVTQENGQWVAIIPNAAEAGNYVHLKLTMSDEGNSRAEQLMMRAYQLK
ncbi:S8 family serine peptidase [Shewanella sp. FJAT-52076]|uniref:S8 family serine peptidase n=1 Tax=Shewanella sp. FJAT-52076 TaxID=2864202 RepID=UPI001C656300|nr:S8 family serine peptidase [Shewanella sp. FJAT-52076]QYJ75944.1 S8 family serine peptidase [Shewanella sp. FJAT-52076]